MTEPNPYQLFILAALQKKGPGEVYQGTVPPNTIATRRRRNKAARLSRRASR